MKTIEITLGNEGDFEKVNALLEQLKLETIIHTDLTFGLRLRISEKSPAVDPVTMLSQASLAEEWESDEDKRWDSFI